MKITIPARELLAVSLFCSDDPMRGSMRGVPEVEILVMPCRVK